MAPPHRAIMAPTMIVAASWRPVLGSVEPPEPDAAAVAPVEGVADPELPDEPVLEPEPLLVPVDPPLAAATTTVPCMSGWIAQM